MSTDKERDSVFIHSSAFVSDKAVIGNNTKIWINSQIRENAEIGSGCIISKDTYIDCNVKIGNSVKIQNGVSIYHGVEIADEVFVGPNAVFTNDYFPRATNENWEIANTYIEKGASLGANSTIICGNRIGRYAMVGAGSVVNRDVQPHGLVVGNPAKMIGYVCFCGKRLDDNYFCKHCKKTIEVK